MPDRWPADPSGNFLEPPDPNGPVPPGWPHPERWPAFVALHDPATTYQSAGDLVGRGRSTISSWMQQWRGMYGPDFLRGLREKSGGSLDGKLRGLDAGRAVLSLRWSERRQDEADRLGKSAGGLFAQIDRWTEQVAKVAGEDLLDRFTARDVYYLGKIADVMQARADRLSDIPDPSRVAGRPRLGSGPDEAGGVPGGLLDGLEALGEGDTMASILADVEKIRAVYVEAQLGAAGRDVIDVDEVDD